MFDLIEQFIYHLYNVLIFHHYSPFRLGKSNGFSVYCDGCDCLYSVAMWTFDPEAETTDSLNAMVLLSEYVIALWAS